MIITKPILGLLLIALCSTAWGKTYEDYVKEAQSKSEVCKRYDEIKLKHSKANTNLRAPTVQETVSAGIMGEDLNKINRDNSKHYLADYLARTEADMKLASECGYDMVKYLPPEGLRLMKERDNEIEAQRASRRAEDDARKNDWFSWKETKYYFMDLLESVGEFLLWPIAIITILAGLMLFTQPREFTRMFFAIIQSIVNLIFKRN